MLGFIKAIAREAGRAAMTYFDGIRPNDVHAKNSPKDLVSAADVAVEQLIVTRIRERFPGHDILGEESGHSNVASEFCWIIDPIDGTQSFVKHHPFFSISIAFCEKNKPVAGVVYAPALGYLFAAEAGKGARLNDELIHASSCAELAEAACATGFACVRAGCEVNNLKYFARIVPNLRDIKRCGSAALDLSMTGAGIYDAYWEMKLQPYDVAAGVLIAEEAGALVRDLRGTFHYPDQGVIAANPALMAKLLPFFNDLPETLC
ncbi:MAG: inositol monophosphatase [Victivallales bacterium]|nr:inositol monophosphatase [Victivallales bacterium]